MPGTITTTNSLYKIADGVDFFLPRQDELGWHTYRNMLPWELSSAHLKASMEVDIMRPKIIELFSRILSSFPEHSNDYSDLDEYMFHSGYYILFSGGRLSSILSPDEITELARYTNLLSILRDTRAYKETEKICNGVQKLLDDGSGSGEKSNISYQRGKDIGMNLAKNYPRIAMLVAKIIK